MCRSAAEGGRRCSGSGRNSGSGPAAADQVGDGGQHESYEGTPWQGYDEFNQRADDLSRRVFEAGSFTAAMEADQLRRGEERIAQIAREGW